MDKYIPRFDEIRTEINDKLLQHENSFYKTKLMEMCNNLETIVDGLNEGKEVKIYTNKHRIIVKAVKCD